MEPKRLCLAALVCLSVLTLLLSDRLALLCGPRCYRLLGRRWRPALPVGNFSCWNDSLLAVFGVAQLDTSRQTFVVLPRALPASSHLSDSCARAIGRLPKRQQPISGQCFRRSYEQKDLLTVYPLLRRLESNFTSRGLTVFLADGSLLGSWRHFGIIPWDDDIDVMVLAAEKPLVRQLLVNLSSLEEFEFVDTERLNQHWRLGAVCREQRSKPRQRRYGSNRLYWQKECRISIDLFFLTRGDPHSTRLEGQHKFLTSSIFPLRRRPFGDQLLLVPRIPRHFLDVEYGTGDATCQFSIHSLRYNCSSPSVGCRQLRRDYAFVSRVVVQHPLGAATAEVLVQNGLLLALFIDSSE